MTNLPADANGFLIQEFRGTWRRWVCRFRGHRWTGFMAVLSLTKPGKVRICHRCQAEERIVASFDELQACIRADLDEISGVDHVLEQEKP